MGKSHSVGGSWCKYDSAVHQNSLVLMWIPISASWSQRMASFLASLLQYDSFGDTGEAVTFHCQCIQLTYGLHLVAEEPCK